MQYLQYGQPTRCHYCVCVCAVARSDTRASDNDGRPIVDVSATPIAGDTPAVQVRPGCAWLALRAPASPTPTPPHLTIVCSVQCELFDARDLASRRPC